MRKIIAGLILLGSILLTIIWIGSDISGYPETDDMNIICTSYPSDNSESWKRHTWVDFHVTGFVRINLQGTNYTEVPDEAYTQTKRLLGEFGEYDSLNLSVIGWGVYQDFSPGCIP